MKEIEEVRTDEQQAPDDLMLESDRFGSRRRRTRRKRLRRRTVVIILVAAAAAAAAIVPARLLTGGGGSGAVEDLAGEADQVTALLVMTLEDDLSRRAETLSLFGVDPDGKNPVLMFIPTTTLTEIPGEGFESLGKAHSVGRGPLQQLAVENMLGLRVDHSVSFSDAVLAGLVDAAGGITVDVPKELLGPDPNDSQRLIPIVQPGRQKMDGQTAVLYFTYLADDETELDAFVRQQAVWEALFARFGEKDAPDLEEVLRRLRGRIVSDATITRVIAVLAAFQEASRRDYVVLPVVSVGAGGSDEAYRIDEEGLARVVNGSFPSSRHPAGVGVGARVELRNGNGVPDVGQQASAQLIRAGMRIVVTGNAPSFGFPATRIIVYENTPQALALGRRVAEILGAGGVEVGRRAQSVVDVTVVLGRDFRPKGD